MKYTFETSSEVEARLIFSADKLRYIICNIRETMCKHINGDRETAVEELLTNLNDQIDEHDLEEVLNPSPYNY